MGRKFASVLDMPESPKPEPLTEEQKSRLLPYLRDELEREERERSQITPARAGSERPAGQ